MLDRKLRQDRHPAHAAEVRENLVPCKLFHLSPCALINFIINLPVNVDIHSYMDCGIAGATIFLHEDLLVRTLVFELELQQWRRSELEAGREDPGRPEYIQVFGVSNCCLSRCTSNPLFIPDSPHDTPVPFH